VATVRLILTTNERGTPLDTVQIATTDYLERQNGAMLELIQKKDEYIIRLQDEVSQKSSAIFTIKAEKQNLISTLKQYVIEAVGDNDITHSVAETLAEICDFELTKTVTITATVDFEVEIEVSFDTDADEVANTLEFSVDSFEYSVDDFSVETHSLQATDNLS
jgi:hypothetical protein